MLTNTSNVFRVRQLLRKGYSRVILAAIAILFVSDSSFPLFFTVGTVYAQASTGDGTGLSSDAAQSIPSDDSTTDAAGVTPPSAPDKPDATLIIEPTPPVVNTPSTSAPTPAPASPAQVPPKSGTAAPAPAPAKSGASASHQAPTQTTPAQVTTAASAGEIFDPMARFLASRTTGSGYEIIINIPAFRLFLYHKGVPVHNYPIAVGKVVSPSNLGTTRIVNKVENPTWYPPDWAKKGLKPVPPGPANPVGTRWLGLAMKGYGIHGTNDPESIGGARSSGCIRMHNKDVEALAKLIPVGTPVTFVYETITVWQQPVAANAIPSQTGALPAQATKSHAENPPNHTNPATWPYIEVFADIYHQGASSTAKVAKLLREAGIAGSPNDDVLKRIITQAQGKPEPFPINSPVDVAGYGTIPGYLAAGRHFVSILDLAKVLGETQAVTIGSALSVYGKPVPDGCAGAGIAYAPVETAAQVFGLVGMDNSDALHIAGVQLDGQLLPARLFNTPDGLLVPIASVAAALGVTVGWDNQTKKLLIDNVELANVQLIGGKAHIPLDIAQKALGVQIHWDPNLAVAAIQRPLTTIGDVQSPGFWHAGEMWIPLRMLADACGLPLSWDSAAQVAQLGENKVNGMLRNGRFYISQAEATTMIPGLTLVWHEAAFTLEMQYAP